MFAEMTGLNNERQWCSNCDNNMVDSNHKESGKFFSVFATVYNPKTKNTNGGEWVQTVFGLCADCCDGKSNLFEHHNPFAEHGLCVGGI